LHVSEKGWSKLANHFTILLSDKDTEMLTKLQAFVDRWRDVMDEFNHSILNRENTMQEELESMKEKFRQWKKDLQENLL
jgi:hypothetical protein